MRSIITKVSFHNLQKSIKLLSVQVWLEGLKVDLEYLVRSCHEQGSVAGLQVDNPKLP